MTLSDDQILERAAQIAKERLEASRNEAQAETRRLYRQYGRRPLKLEHDLGKPKKLGLVETLLVAALDRTRYKITAECPNGNRWHGDAECASGVRGMVIAMMHASRLELLWELWRSVSNQPVERVTLTEDHLQGSVYHKHLRELGKELNDVRNL